MVANKKLLVLPGDGIGPEVMEQVLRVVDWFGDNRAVGFDVKQDLVAVSYTHLTLPTKRIV